MSVRASKIRRMNANAARRTLITVIAAALAPVAAAGAENTLVFDNVGGWAVKTDLNREYRCFVEADYDNGSAVRAGFNSDDGRFYISVSDFNWDWVEVGVDYAVALAFDEEPAQELAATGIVLETQFVQSGVLLHVPAELADHVVSQFMYRNEMHLSYGEEASLTLGLVGTQRATEALETCQTTMARSAESTELSQLR